LKTAWLAGIALIFGASPLLAHDLWIEPTSFAPRPGQVIGVKLRVGMNLEGDPVPRVPGLIREFVVAGDSDRRTIAGREGADPAGIMRVAAQGLKVIGYYSKPSFIELPAEKFNPYLEDEGLDAIVAFRAGHGQSEKAAREIYSRCAKSLVLAGAPSETEGDRRLGFALELIAGAAHAFVGVYRRQHTGFFGSSVELGEEVVVRPHRVIGCARTANGEELFERVTRARNAPVDDRLQ